MPHQLTKISLLAHPSSDASLSLIVDASNVGVGAILQQQVQGSWQPLAFFSKRLKPAETRYSTFGREILAAYSSIKHFRHYLEGRAFTLYTDHKPLTFALYTKADKYNPRELRHLDYISQFTEDIKHIAGTDNTAADALSRLEISALQSALDIDLELLASDQKNLDRDNEELSLFNMSTALLCLCGHDT